MQFALAGFLAIAGVGAFSAFLLQRAGVDEATRDAKQVSALAGRGIVEPLVTQRLLNGDPRALRRMDAVVSDRILGHDGIVRVKIWDADSRIVYSDEERLVGDRFELGDEELEILQRRRHRGRADRPLAAWRTASSRARSTCSRSTCRSAVAPASRCCSRPTSAPAS